MAPLNKFGRLPMGYVMGNGTVFPSAEFQRWLDTQLQRTGGVDESLTATEYETAVGAPVATPAPVIDGGPVSVFTVPIDGSPV